MKDVRLVKLQWFKALVLICALAPAAHARVGGGESTLAAISPVTAPQADAPSFADKIGAIIEMRTMMVNRVAPQPAADCTDPQAIARRLSALKELDLFTRMTINGLIDAAPSSELKSEASEDLTPLLLRHRQDMTAALYNLMELPLVREKSTPEAAKVAAEVVQLVSATRP